MPAQSLRGANWGALEVDATKKVLRMTSTVDVGETILQIPLSKVTQASGNKTELGLTFARQPASDDDIVMTEIRFAVPKTCVGFEEVEDAGKQLLRLVQDQLVGSSGAAAAGGSGGAAAGADAGTKVAVFADVALSQPSGVFTIEMTTTWMVFTDLKKNTTFRLPVSTISRSFSLPVPTGDSTYLVICLTEPVRIGTTQHHNIVLTFRDDLVIPEDTPWEAEISDQAKLDALFGGAEKNLIRPKMTGKVADMVASVVKTVSQKKLLGHQTSEFRGYEHDTLPVVNAQLRSTDGFLFLLREFLLFLHRPATLIAYTDVAEAKFESAGSYSATISVQLSVKKAGGAAGARGAALEKVLFGGIPRKEMLGLDKWFRDKGVAVLNPETAIDVDEDDEEDDESYAEGDSDDEDDDDADSADDDFDDDDDDGGKKKKKEKKSKKDKKDKSDKKEKKDKSDKKEKKDKSDKKEKKDKSDKKEKKDKSDKKRKRDAQE